DRATRVEPGEHLDRGEQAGGLHLRREIERGGGVQGRLVGRGPGRGGGGGHLQGERRGGRRRRPGAPQPEPGRVAGLPPAAGVGVAVAGNGRGGASGVGRRGHGRGASLQSVGQSRLDCGGGGGRGRGRASPLGGLAGEGVPLDGRDHLRVGQLFHGEV